MKKQNRLPPINQDQMTSEQKKMMDAVLAGPRKNLQGPFAAWVHSPQFGQLAQQLGAYCRYETGLPLHLSELAILTTAALWQSQAEWQIHLPIALQAGLSHEIAEQIRIGAVPSFTNEDERIVWQFATELYQYKRVSDKTYEAVSTRFGLPVVVNLIGLLGYYAMVAMTLNVFDIRAEQQGALPFSEH